MIKNFLFVLKRFKTSSVINILGLSVALTVFFVVLMQVHYDFTYDRGYANADKIAMFYMIKDDGSESNGSTSINLHIPAQINDRLPEVEAYCSLSYMEEEPFDVDRRHAAPQTFRLRYLCATPGFTDVFTPEILAGDVTGVFEAPGRAMISQKTAQRLFGDENPIGKTLRHHYTGQQLTVQAVCRNFPENATLGNDIYTFLHAANRRGDWSYQACFLIHPDKWAAVSEKINTPELLGEETASHFERQTVRVQLSSPNSIYLERRINTTLSLLATGILTLLIAFVNFINLSLAMAPSRVRGIAIRKILGAGRNTLRTTVAAESVLFTALAAAIAFAGICLLRGSTFAQELFPTIGISLRPYIAVFATALGIILLLAFAIGTYTSHYSTSFDEAEAMKGSFARGVRGVKMRNFLIVIQFTAAIALTCISIFIRRQNSYMMNFDWKIPKENIIYLPATGLGRDAATFGEELLRDPHISDFCTTDFLPGHIWSNSWDYLDGKHINFDVWPVDSRFFDFFDIDILAGRKPDHIDSLVSQMVANETLLRKYEFDESIVGRDFDRPGRRIQAIAEDVHFHSLHDSIVPMTFCIMAQRQNLRYILVKLTGNEVPAALGRIEQVWKQFGNDPFEAHFLDEFMDRLYQSESNMAKLIGLFGLIIVVIAIMGVYGLIVFNARYKAKEIAIRKVNGSSGAEIMLLLNRTILIRLAIAFVVAIPIAYCTAFRWLQNFAYKTPLSWWVFLLGGLIVLLVTVLTVSAQSYRAASQNPTKALNSA
jgi:putative ABC transport system permease protein